MGMLVPSICGPSQELKAFFNSAALVNTDTSTPSTSTSSRRCAHTVNGRSARQIPNVQPSSVSRRTEPPGQVMIDKVQLYLFSASFMDRRMLFGSLSEGSTW